MEKEKFGQSKELLQTILRDERIAVCEYRPQEDRLLIYDNALAAKREIPAYLEHLEKKSMIHPDDRWKMREFLWGRIGGKVEIRYYDGEAYARMLSLQALQTGEEEPPLRFPLMIRDVTQEKTQQSIWEDRAKKDSLTMIYNRFFGRELIDEYLKNKDPYSTCGMMVVDIDYFKYANDIHGHLFGDQVLVRLANLLQMMFEEKDVVMRAGGDEFVVFLKDIGHSALVRKAMQLVKAVREMPFEGVDYSATCSVGVCFLTENLPGYTYDQLFENADWALYQAKNSGRNCYVFCDSLQRFELEKKERPPKEHIDIRYLHNDVISTAFEIFEKMSSFSVAIEFLMEIIGYRFQLDRITVIRTDIREQNAGRQYQWVSESAPEVLQEPGSFTKEDFLTLFQSYDENLTTVLQHDNMGMYSPQGAALLMQGGAKTVLYAAMYCEGKYTGAISYVVCQEKRYWSKQNRKELSEVTKIISAHLARSQAVNPDNPNKPVWMEYDSLTGLLSFTRFHQEAERRILGNYANSDLMLYSDFADFKYFNQKYGYSAGDQLLKEYSSFYSEKVEKLEEVFFCRVISDQFLMLYPGGKGDDAAAQIDAWNKEFERRQAERFQGAKIKLRTGVYVIEPGCTGASFAIDAANYARRQISRDAPSTVKVYDESLRLRRRLESEIINGIGEAMQEQRLLVYLQPKVSLADGTVRGAEALVRWKTKEGKLLTPPSFVPLCEANGLIEELDFYVFECVAQFLAKNRSLGRRQLPISVNASIRHAFNPGAVQKYLDILHKYQIEPAYTEIELTQTATAEEYENARRFS